MRWTSVHSGHGVRAIPNLSLGGLRLSTQHHGTTFECHGSRETRLAVALAIARRLDSPGQSHAMFPRARDRTWGRGAQLIRTLACVALLLAASGPVRAGTIVVLQHQPGDPSRPWTWRLIIEHLPMIRAAGYTAILLSPHEKACGGQWSLGYDP